MRKKIRSKADLLSTEMKIAAEIFKYNKDGEKIWFTKLADGLKGELSSTTILNALGALMDWGIVKVQYGESDKGKAARLLVVSGEAESTIAKVYEQYWSGRRNRPRD